MAEEGISLTQRVEALEQISHARVVERIGQIEQRVSRIESARKAVEPHVATKEDIARLETLLETRIAEVRSGLQKDIADTQEDIARLEKQIGEVQSGLKMTLPKRRPPRKKTLPRHNPPCKMRMPTRRWNLKPSCDIS